MFVIALLFLVPISVQAQGLIVVNPTAVAWDHPNDDLTLAYDGGYFMSDTALLPFQSETIPKPTGSPCVDCTAPLGSRPSAPGTYWFRMREITVDGQFSEWSSPPVPFQVTPVRSPAAPTGVELRP